VIDKMSVGASRAIGRLIDNQKTGAAQTDAIRSPDKNGKTDGSNSSLTAAIDHMVQQGMPVDVEHIISIRQAIAEGKYPLNPVAIADRMIDFDRSGHGF
jgi:flagellar biosynthesis anti-sigma factor FlgM